MAARIRPSDEVVQANIKKWGIPQPEKEYTVLIHCTTYNHGKYIKEALEGFVMQKCSFSFCAIIIDDCSTDNNAEIIREYAEKYPDIIKPILLGENHMQRGILRDPYFEKWHQSAKYIAQCEGDDYWTDPHKLQIQYEFMENNPQYLFCCHRYKILEQKTQRFLREYTYDYYVDNRDLTIDESLFLKVWVTQTLTAFLRTDVYAKTYCTLLNKYSSSRDVYFYYTLLQAGKGISLNREMGVYRWHEGGVAIGQKPYQRYRTGFSIYTEIFEKNPHDKLLVPKVIYNGIRLLRYSELNGEALSIFNYLWKLSNCGKEKMNLVASLIIPSSIYIQLAKVYSKRRLDRLTFLHDLT